MLKNLLKFLFVHFGPFYVIRKIKSLLVGPEIVILFGHRVLPDKIMSDKNNPRRVAGHASASEVEKSIQDLSKLIDLLV